MTPGGSPLPQPPPCPWWSPATPLPGPTVLSCPCAMGTPLAPGDATSPRRCLEPPREQHLRSVGLSACLSGALLVLLNERFLIKPSCCTKSNALQKSNHPISTQVPSAARQTHGAPKQGAEDKDGSLVHQQHPAAERLPKSTPAPSLGFALSLGLLHQHPQPPRTLEVPLWCQGWWGAPGCWWVPSGGSRARH